MTTGKVLDIDLDDGCGDPTNVAGLYDPSDATFAAERMTALRRGASATLLSDGTVLIAGGGDSSNGSSSWWVGATSGAELYDPVMNVRRHGISGRKS
jgi:hypothetical protein